MLPVPSAMTQRAKLTEVADLMKRGATLLRDACPKCGGIQLRYKNKTLCASCDDLASSRVLESPQPSEVMANLGELVATKIRETCLLLKSEKDIERQAQLANLLLKYVELMERTANALEKVKQS